MRTFIQFSSSQVLQITSKYSRTSLDKRKSVNHTREKENRFQKEKKEHNVLRNVLSYENKKGSLGRISITADEPYTPSKTKEGSGLPVDGSVYPFNHELNARLISGV
ncbi:kinesin-13A-like [Dorcoceras hygrometricum]|uniref:Kinesin-13A-like n=1 Tax=Dorcoceras hygrometricum TaxID=472368 RepID=A0A2Z7B774_9LAMI|nr:kinesin-13A-like [Dorcoceras hygrometricum]